MRLSAMKKQTQNKAKTKPISQKPKINLSPCAARNYKNVALRRHRSESSVDFQLTLPTCLSSLCLPRLPILSPSLFLIVSRETLCYPPTGHPEGGRRFLPADPRYQSEVEPCESTPVDRRPAPGDQSRTRCFPIRASRVGESYNAGPVAWILSLTSTLLRLLLRVISTSQQETACLPKEMGYLTIHRLAVQSLWRTPSARISHQRKCRHRPVTRRAALSSRRSAQELRAEHAGFFFHHASAKATRAYAPLLTLARKQGGAGR